MPAAHTHNILFWHLLIETMTMPSNNPCIYDMSDEPLRTVDGIILNGVEERTMR
jgi:hypothetical protein